MSKGLTTLNNTAKMNPKITQNDSAYFSCIYIYIYIYILDIYI